MDVYQVNSRVLHDDGETSVVENGNQDAVTNSNKAEDQGTNNLEKKTTEVSSASYEESFPEGGMRAWLVVLGAWFALMSAMGLMNTVAIFQAYTLSHQLKGHSEGTVGWIFSVYNFLAFFCGVYIGPVFDKYGPRWLVIAGCITTVTGVVCMSFCKELWQFILSFGVLCGLGTSLLFTPCIAAVGHWFRKRRGFATGMASTAGGIGGIVFPLMLTSLFDQIGYGWATRVLALVCLVGGVIGILLVRSRLAPAPNATAHPDFRIFKQVPYTLTAIGIFLLEFSLFIPLAYISTYAQHKGFGEKFAFHLLPIMNAGSVVGRALPGYYADVVGPFNVCLFSVLLSLVACLCVWLPLGHTAAGIIVFSILFGFGSGTSISIAPVCIGRMCKTQQYGRYYATTYTVVSFACLIGIPIGGNIVGASGGDYKNLIIFTGAIYVGSAVFLMAAKTAHLGMKDWLSAY
ncbi:MFS monocarboxylate transporter, putative [Metarhizium acridum CQMa 102]|uniref:MFS monocarboxylate transporter, putative n=1 Tax=Metarhizium acridum (strain CQMa 102) TaxID=655827 RepID=E9DT67_METAQ|nr:MFS monocarboxylate transporter, putative [Metarhizium acridum CQMa 102]EFY93166.1 MFS monocarboxylate transporter, putative [Metarhizium acridum CQMa 102]